MAERRLSYLEDAFNDLAGQPGVCVMFAAGVVAGVRSRLDKGERTAELYAEIMELE